MFVNVLNRSQSLVHHISDLVIAERKLLLRPLLDILIEVQLTELKGNVQRALFQGHLFDLDDVVMSQLL